MRGFVPFLFSSSAASLHLSLSRVLAQPLVVQAPSEDVIDDTVLLDYMISELSQIYRSVVAGVSQVRLQLLENLMSVVLELNLHVGEK